MANEGSYPENARALAMNGAEVLYRGSIPHPAASNYYFEIQNRARALDNNLYILAPNMGTYFLTRGLRGAHRHVRRHVDDRRLPRPDRRPAALRRRVDVGVRADQHRGAPPSPRHERLDELDEGPAHGDVPTRLRSSRSTRRTSTSSGRRTGMPSTRRPSPTARCASCTSATSGPSPPRRRWSSTCWPTPSSADHLAQTDPVARLHRGRCSVSRPGVIVTIQPPSPLSAVCHTPDQCLAGGDLDDSPPSSNSCTKR